MGQDFLDIQNSLYDLFAAYHRFIFTRGEGLFGYFMVLTLDGSSEHGANIWSKSGIAICWRHLVTSYESSNPIFFLEKTYFLHKCATSSELPSNVSTMAENYNSNSRDHSGVILIKNTRKSGPLCYTETGCSMLQIVTQNMLRTHEGKSVFSEKNIRFVTFPI